ncbi:MAG TPA: DUF2071 domain-containing protein [Blastocatellia bacterium]|nr:DUF2071 domain-containing protein [Blastocatellia bacterium]
MENGIFLTAEWRYLAMLNYQVDPLVLRAYVPSGTELDQWGGRTYVSLVGFLFLKTRVLGLRIPFHENFEEINLRFYVRRRSREGWRRGVVFIREIVPRPAIAAAARVLYHENYAARPMSHRIEMEAGRLSAEGRVEYAWREGRAWNRLSLKSSGDPQPLEAGSEPEFITEHYWGYSAQRDGGCVEYRVEHPSWRVWGASEAVFEGDLERAYGPTFAEVLRVPPVSAFLAEGSPVIVRRGIRI